MASPEGILAHGGNLSPGVLLSAYENGIFPWFNEGGPILWWSPDPRFILLPEELHCPRSLRRLLNKNPFTFTFDTVFDEVIRHCSEVPRPGQRGTWITEGMIQAYGRMHTLGYVHSLEVWAGGELVGGLYGLSLGGVFFGESMFSFQTGASKAGFVTLVCSLGEAGFSLFDCQVPTSHLRVLGAREVPRAEFLKLLERGLERPTLKNRWTDFSPLLLFEGKNSSGKMPKATL